jgi:hypothetical protein
MPECGNKRTGETVTFCRCTAAGKDPIFPVGFVPTLGDNQSRKP